MKIIRRKAAGVLADIISKINPDSLDRTRRKMTEVPKTDIDSVTEA